MMMLPGITTSPPNFFTPSRLPAESRPLRELPPAFLCALADQQDPADLERAAGLDIELLDLDHVVLGDAILLAAGSDHCVHHCLGRGWDGSGPRSSAVAMPAPKRRRTIATARPMSTQWA